MVHEALPSNRFPTSIPGALMINPWARASSRPVISTVATSGLLLLQIGVTVRDVPSPNAAVTV